MLFSSLCNVSIVFGRAIQSLSKVGDELYFEPREDGLFLRSVNSSRSAYACFQFSPNFFDHYVDVSVQETEDEESFRCKIGMKSVMTVFRNLAALDKMVEKCRVSLNTSEDRLVFQMYCRHGIIKTHKLAFIECETLQAVCSKDLCPNKITSIPKLLCDAVLNFQANQEEITLIVRPDFLALQNYMEDNQDATKVMRTELTLSPDEFDQYQVGVDTDITFCLKELRTGLHPLLTSFLWIAFNLEMITSKSCVL
ncbi:cell cycle checkpoint control protein RAD9A-like [Elysia marginata]|uniref:Cell cycle checkpoint control protein RAD9A n=1 Tax=Elysia marginata TaxID=1093978 RepID=A0AAV4JCJ0_9GAST|nr:cell cycle checkpoint control protein RAD9A-like [Elysia marginata]